MCSHKSEGFCYHCECVFPGKTGKVHMRDILFKINTFIVILPYHPVPVKIVNYCGYYATINFLSSLLFFPLLQ